MRLTCPNCTAQYEVDDSVIPEGGRDVQCSACGHTWFQYAAETGRGLIGTGLLRADHQRANVPSARAPGTAPTFASGADAPSASPARSAGAPLPPAQSDAWEGDDADEDEADLVDAPETASPAAISPSAPPPGAAMPPRRVDQGVLDLLREEADREIRERQRGREAAIETQSELGLEEVQRTASPPLNSGQAGGIPAAAPANIASPMGRTAPGAPAAAESRSGTGDDSPGRSPRQRREGARVPRRDLLPDIEELSSTLEPVEMGRGDDDDARGALPPDRGRDFRRGISLVLLIATTLTAVYVLAPMLRDAVPFLAAPLDGYVQLVDALRLWAARLLTGG